MQDRIPTHPVKTQDGRSENAINFRNEISVLISRVTQSQRKHPVEIQQLLQQLNLTLEKYPDNENPRPLLNAIDILLNKFSYNAISKSFVLTQIKLFVDRAAQYFELASMRKDIEFKDISDKPNWLELTVPLTSIFRYLSTRDLVSCKKTCRKWYANADIFMSLGRDVVAESIADSNVYASSSLMTRMETGKENLADDALISVISDKHSDPVLLFLEIIKRCKNASTLENINLALLNLMATRLIKDIKETIIKSMYAELRVSADRSCSRYSMRSLGIFYKHVNLQDNEIHTYYAIGNQIETDRRVGPSGYTPKNAISQSEILSAIDPKNNKYKMGNFTRTDCILVFKTYEHALEYVKSHCDGYDFIDQYHVIFRVEHVGSLDGHFNRTYIQPRSPGLPDLTEFPIALNHRLNYVSGMAYNPSKGYPWIDLTQREPEPSKCHLM